MSYTKFTIVLLAIYIAYYVINIILDSLKTKGNGAKKSNVEELTFSEDIVATEVGGYEAEIISQEIPQDIAEEIPQEIAEEIAAPTWEREEEDTEEIPILTNNNVSTGGVDISEMMKLIQAKTIDIKHKVVF